jgi:hypothetical protein
VFLLEIISKESSDIKQIFDIFYLDQRPYRCDFCDRSYKSRQSMKEHEYQCPFKNVSLSCTKNNTNKKIQEKNKLSPMGPNFEGLKSSAAPFFAYNPMMRFPLPQLQSLTSTYMNHSIIMQGMFIFIANCSINNNLNWLDF